MASPDMPLHWLSASATAAAVRAGRHSARRIAEAVLGEIERRNPMLNCFRTVLADRALREAGAVDAAIADGRDPGCLAGVPFGVKELFDVTGLPTLAGSIINAGRSPARRDAVLASRLGSEGAVLLGTQNMDEFAYGFTTENAHYGPARNPHDPAHSAGGSSGGSAAAVAAGLGAISLASDTNGSIRVPASFCGIFGLKPTFGRLPRTGSFPFVFDLDHLGPLARSAEDLALIYDCLQGADPDDPACASRPAEPVSRRLHQYDTGRRAAVLGGWFTDMAGAEARDAVRVVADALGARRTLSLPGAREARGAAFLLTAASGANLHREALTARPQDFDPATRDRLLAGGLIPAQSLLQAGRVRRWFAEQAQALFRECDLLIAAATPVLAPRIGQTTMQLAGQELPVRPNIGVLTQPISCIGLPVVVVPLRRAGSLPIGVQLIAPPWREDIALQAASWLQARGVVGGAAV